MPVGLRDQRILGRKVMIDQTYRHLCLRADAPDRQSVVAELLQALDGGFNQRQPPLIRQLALEARGRVFFSGALQSGSSNEPPPFEVTQNLARRVVARGSRYAAARMGSRSAHVQARQRPSIVPVTQGRPCREHLIELQ